MKKNNHNGFTMVELLAAIVILGIIMTIGVASIVNIRKAQEEKHNRHQIEIFKQTAKTYFTDNKSKLPIEPMGTKTVTLKELIDANYIDSLLKYNKEPYEEDSYVTVQFIGNGRYGYTSSLKDGEKEIPDDDPNTAKIKYDFPVAKDLTKPEALSFSSSSDDKKKYYTNRNSKIKIELSDTDGIAAYQYKITGNKIKKESEYIYVVSGKSKVEDSIILNINDYPDGIYKLTFTIWDINGYEKTYSGAGAKIYLDTKKPTCETEITGADVENENSNPILLKWTKDNVKITPTCSDKLSGCSDKYANEEEKEYQDQVETTFNRTFYDKAGNSTKCPSYKVRIDKTKPICGEFSVTDGSIGDKNWYIEDINIKVGCSDEGGSKCTKTEFTQTETTEGNIERKITIEDNAGNKEVCKKIYAIDKTKPICGDFSVTEGTSGNNGWYKSNISIKVGCSDSASDCIQQTYTQSETTEGNLERKIIIKNNAGLTTTCTKKIAIDKTPPTCTSTGGNPNWIKNSIVLTGICEDLGGSDCNNIQRTVDATSGSFINSTTESAGTVYDNAGNSGLCTADQTVRIDRKNPTKPTSGTIKYSITKDNKVKIKVKATGSTDTNQSGIKEYRFVIKKNSTKPAKSDFETTSEKEVDSNTLYHVWAIAVDNVGNLSAIRKIGKKTSISPCEAGTDYDDWGACTCAVGGSCTQVRDVTKTTCENGNEKVEHSTETQSCSVGEHNHIWNVRGNQLRGYHSWTCNGHKHTRSTWYNIYCSICGISALEYKRATDASVATRACSDKDYAYQNDDLYAPGIYWKVVNDSHITEDAV